MAKTTSIYIPREMEAVLKEAVGQFSAVAVTGPRQSGKSTLLRKMFLDTHAYVSFDDPLTRERAIADPRLFLESLGERMIVDEIQYVPQLLSYVKILIDKNRHKRGCFLFTGSQQFSMIKNLGDTLAGRVALLELLPFSVTEKALAYNHKNKKRAASFTAQKYFTHACLRGSFPEIIVRKGIDVELWYGSYQQTYLERDIRTIYNIGNLRDFQRFLRLLAARCAQVLNLSSLAADLGIVVNTVKRWLSVLEASRIVYLLNPYSGNIGKRITKSPKVYFLDCGFVCHLLSLKDEDFLLKGPMAGALFENFCLQETIKAIFNYAKSMSVFYIRAQNALEVDLIIEKSSKLYPVEFKLTKTPTMQMGEPILRFKRLFPKLSIMPGRIVSLCSENIPLTRDIAVQTMDDYLHWLKSA
ncbi:ATP-binding protein [candidate division WOR-3 bacterium]|nr:ATP-binding protein [candidate division WOR-3 bacterium]